MTPRRVVSAQRGVALPRRANLRRIDRTYRYRISMRTALLRTLAIAFWLLASSAALARQPDRIDEIRIGELPRDAVVTLQLIGTGGPFLQARDGVVFGNRERILPLRPRGYYREYTVRTPGVRSRGARRIVCGGEPRATDDCYYSDDHYQSFRRIR